MSTKRTSCGTCANSSAPITGLAAGGSAAPPVARARSAAAADDTSAMVLGAHVPLPLQTNDKTCALDSQQQGDARAPLQAPRSRSKCARSQAAAQTALGARHFGSLACISPLRVTHVRDVTEQMKISTAHALWRPQGQDGLCTPPRMLRCSIDETGRKRRHVAVRCMSYCKGRARP